MNLERRQHRTNKRRDMSLSLDSKLASYLAASASIGAMIASDAKAVVVSNSTAQPFGINGNVNIDFNSDGQTDFQIDHDRVDLGAGNVVDYLQVDKNDVNGASPGEDPLPINSDVPFAVNGTITNNTWESSYLVQASGSSNIEYPTALLAGAEIGPSSVFDFQEGTNVQSSMTTGRLNRLIDEDHGQVDMVLGGLTGAQITTPTNTPQFLGVENQVRYLGVKMDLNNAAPDHAPLAIRYGWIGIKITNEADATGEVVGWGYETTAGQSILAGAVAPGVAGDYNGNGKVDAADYVLWRNGGPLQNDATPGVQAGDYAIWTAQFGQGSGSGSGLGAVPEPSTLLMGLGMGLAMLGALVFRRIRGS